MLWPGRPLWHQLLLQLVSYRLEGFPRGRNTGTSLWNLQYQQHRLGSPKIPDKYILRVSWGRYKAISAIETITSKSNDFVLQLQPKKGFIEWTAGIYGLMKKTQTKFILRIIIKRIFNNYLYDKMSYVYQNRSIFINLIGSLECEINLEELTRYIICSSFSRTKHCLAFWSSAKIFSPSSGPSEDANTAAPNWVGTNLSTVSPENILFLSNWLSFQTAVVHVKVLYTNF